jgi:predicted permease
LLAWTVAASGVAVFLALAAVVDGLLLKPPFRGAERVVVVRPLQTPERPNVRGIAVEDFSLAEARTGLSAAAMGWPSPLGRAPDAPLRTWVSTNFFDVIGVRPSLGRTFVRADHTLADRAVISDRLWRTRFGADPDIIDRTVVLGGMRLTVVGVLAGGFRVPDGTDVWIPHPDDYSYHALVRLPSGMSIEAMRARLGGWRVVSLPDHLAPDDATHALVLLGSGGLLLLGAWVYLGLLQAGEAARRVEDTALRLALGAGPWRATRASLLEGYLSVAACLALGTIAAPAVLTSLLRRLPPELLAGHPIALDARTAVTVLGLLAAGSVVVTLIALPAMLSVLRRRLSDAQTGTRTRRHAARSTRWIVAAQFAAAAPVLYMLGLAATSFHALLSTDLGYRPTSVVSAQIPPRHEVFDDEGFSFESAARYVSRLQQLLDRVAAMPGIHSAAVSSDRIGYTPTAGFTRVRRRDAGEDGFVAADEAIVSGAYFDVLDVPIVAGRAFGERARLAMDLSDGYGGVVIDEALAQALGEGEDMVGRGVIVDFTPATVVGVVGSVRSRRPDEPSRPRVYLNVSPATSAATNLLVRFSGDAGPIRRAVSLAVQEEFGTAGPADSVLWAEELARLQAPYRGRYELLALMGWIAGTLTAAGTFGVVSYTVARRRRELAVRMAVGATRGRILWVCLRDVLAASAVGIAVGLLGGVVLGRQAADLLYAVTPMEPAVLASIIALLLLVVVAGAAFPIRDAWKTDVAAVLRQD